MKNNLKSITEEQAKELVLLRLAHEAMAAEIDHVTVEEIQPPRMGNNRTKFFQIEYNVYYKDFYPEAYHLILHKFTLREVEYLISQGLIEI
jgi:hypothetical protein